MNQVLVIEHKGSEQSYTGSINHQFHLREIFEISSIQLKNEDKIKNINLRNPEDWILLLDLGFITHDYKDCEYIRDYLLEELKFSDVDIPLQVIDVLFKDGRKKGFYKNPSSFLSCCRNKNFLVYFLHLGYKFKKVKGCGHSTMESYFNPIHPMFLDSILCYPKALDKKWIKKNKQKILNCVIHIAEYDKELADWVGQLLIK